MDLFVEGGKNSLRLVINQYEPIVKFELPKGNNNPSFKVSKEKLEASFNGINVELSFDFKDDKIKIFKKLGLQEHVLGMGEKALPLDKRRTRCTFWNYDNYGYQFYSDPLYCSIPFIIFVEEGKAFGLFINSTTLIHVDVGIVEYDKVIIEIFDKGAEIYLIFGPAIKEVVETYTEITGRPFLPPLWAFGYMISRYSYYPQDYVIEIVEKTLKEAPLSAIFLDIDYMKGYRIFTWDEDKFPNPKEMSKKLKEMGVKLVTIIDPYIKVDENYQIFQESKEFCVKKQRQIYITKGWPGDCILPDFFNQRAREWWSKKIEEFAKEYGIDGIWLDMNEPTVFNSSRTVKELLEKYAASKEIEVTILTRYLELIALAENYLTSPILSRTKNIEELLDKSLDLDSLHFLDDGRIVEHRYARNAYAYYEAMATYNGLKRIHKRPFILSRSGYAGIQKYAAIWTGDVPATWYAMSFTIPILLSLSLSGVAICGVDLGGFVGRSEPELIARWYQAFCFAPVYRIHKEKGGTEEELFNLPSKYREMAKRAISLRYKFIPYLWHLAWEAHLKGSPILRPLCYEFQEDNDSYLVEDEYLVGPYLLYSPILEKNQETKNVYLPPSIWYDYWNDKVYKGSNWIKVSDEMPLFIREGSAIPIEAGLIIFGNGSWDIYHGEEGNLGKITFNNSVIEQKGEPLEIKELILLNIEAKKVLVDEQACNYAVEKNKTKIFLNKKFNEIKISF